jgi:hypothetical protein
MTDTAFNIKKFLLNAVLTLIITYIIAFMIIGIVWDPNGVNLFERPVGSMMTIIITGLMMSIPMAIGSFIANHPVPVTMGLGFFACFIIGLLGIRETTGKRLLYALLSFLTTLGTLQFCLMA